ncbi:MAG: ABC transporter transmembrane domain-containing protein, partial [Gammaproteobacteria bacterium]
RLTFASGADISIEVYRRALYQPYRVHVRRNTSEMISGITGKVGHTTLGVLLPLLTLLSSGVLLVAIISTLLAVDPFLATVAAAGFGLSYALITWVSRRRLRRNSEHIARENTKVIKALQEGLGGIRDVLLNGSQQVYCDVYREADRRWRLAQGENVFIGQSPRFAMEALGMVLIASLA